MKFGFRNRVAMYYMMSTAFFTGIVLLGIYGIVYKTFYDHLDEDLDFESEEIVNNITVIGGKIIFINEGEWTEREHRQIEVNPTFMQVSDLSGNIIRKSPNLKDTVLVPEPDHNNARFYSSILSGSPVRQFQKPIIDEKGAPAYVLVMAMPMKDTLSFLRDLAYIMLISYPLILIPLFFISRVIAGRSISPIESLKKTAARISKSNLKERIELPVHKDEIYELICTINDLLNRLEDAIIKEHQFSADASHELRTPLSIIKGTLEVLLRKPRSEAEYAESIGLVIEEVDRIAEMVEQLLYLSRLDETNSDIELEKTDLNTLIDLVIERLSGKFEEKCLRVNIEMQENVLVQANHNMLNQLIYNLLANSAKYSPAGKEINIGIENANNTVILKISDQGPGIPDSDLKKIFDRFYRSDKSRNSKIPGLGLGLSIVKKLADLQGIELQVKSNLNQGTEFSVIFPL